MGRRPDPARSHAVLIGVGNYRCPELPDIPATQANLTDLRSRLIAPGAGSFEDDRCVLVCEPRYGEEIGEAVHAAGRAATDVLLVYYTGHGLLDSRGRLHLGLVGSNPDRARFTALPFDTLREELLDSGASTRILILDCCFSGRAFEAMSDPATVVAGETDIAGTYTMTSSARNETSYAPIGDRNTAFTAALLATIDTPAKHTLDTLFRNIETHLTRNGHPRPQRRSVNIAGDLILFDNLETRSIAGPQLIKDMPGLSEIRYPLPPVDHIDNKAAHRPAEPATTADTRSPATAPHLATGSVGHHPIGVGTGSRRRSTTAADSTLRRRPLLISEPTLLAGHASAVCSVAFNHDSALLATSSSDKTARLWDVATGKQIGEAPTSYANPVWPVTFNHDGTLLVTGSSSARSGGNTGQTVWLWNVLTGNLIEVALTGAVGTVWPVVFSHDGALLATGDFSKKVWLCDVATGKQIAQPLRHTSPVLSVAFSHDGSMIATSSDDKKVWLWDVATGKQIAEPLGHIGPVLSVAFSHDGSMIATSSDDKKVWLWDVATG
ncbi:caspase, EACC1-associated type, partial [Nocardia sp. NPDC055049]